MNDAVILPGSAPAPTSGGAPDHPIGCAVRRPTPGVAEAFRRRAVPLASAAVVVVLGVLFAFFWDPVVRHSQSWTDPSDLWGIFRGAQYVSWGFLGGIYNQDTGMVTFPGIALLLAPVALVSDALHLSSSIGSFRLAYPTAELLLFPVEMVLASTVLFGADALAEELAVPRLRRGALCVVVAVLAWPTAAIWGHAEDALVMTFALYAMVAVLRGNWHRAGWLLGVGILLQPLIALTIPLFLAASPPGQRMLFALRCSVLSVFLVGVAFLGNPSGAYRALVEQPTPPLLNHATPWVALAPHVLLPGASSADGALLMHPHGSRSFSEVTAAGHPLLQVAGGPGRTLYVVLALLVGVFVWRRPQAPIQLLWLAGAVLAGRCFFEAVMTPYYLAPPLFLLLVLAARKGAVRWWASSAVALGISWFAYWHFGPWVWWLPIVACLVLLLALTCPEASGPPLVERPDVVGTPSAAFRDDVVAAGVSATYD
jgi:hypothetical protein